MKEEHLNEAAGRDWCENVLDRDLKPITKQAFKRGARWHESLPLADRLSESEKEKIKELYADLIPMKGHMAGIVGQMMLLERIFGKDLFTKSE